MTFGQSSLNCPHVTQRVPFQHPFACRNSGELGWAVSFDARKDRFKSCRGGREGIAGAGEKTEAALTLEGGRVTYRRLAPVLTV